MTRPKTKTHREFIMSQFSMKGFSTTSIVPALVLVLSFALNGCDNGTTRPLCSEANGHLEGITGIYKMHLRNSDDWSLTKATVRIVPDEKDSRKASFKNDDDIEIEICNINGVYVAEAKFEEQQFVPSRMYVTQAGLQFAPLMFDKRLLDAAGIPSDVVVIPESLRKIVGKSFAQILGEIASFVVETVSDEESTKVLMIDNTAHKASEVLQYAQPSSLGFTIYRE